MLCIQYRYDDSSNVVLAAFRLEYDWTTTSTSFMFSSEHAHFENLRPPNPKRFAQYWTLVFVVVLVLQSEGRLCCRRCFICLSQMVTIIDPHIKREGGYHIHEASDNVTFLLPSSVNFECRLCVVSYSSDSSDR